MAPRLRPPRLPPRRKVIRYTLLAFAAVSLLRIVTIDVRLTAEGEDFASRVWASSKPAPIPIETPLSTNALPPTKSDTDFPSVKESALVVGLNEAFGQRPRKQLPEEVAEQACQNWWRGYSSYHKTVLSHNGSAGWPAPRLAVVKKGRGVLGDGGGLGDTVSSQVSSLVFAMLTGRVFQVYWTKARFVLESPYIDTRYTGPEEYLDLTPDKEDGGLAQSGDGAAQSSCVQMPYRIWAADWWLDDEVRKTGDFDRGRLSHQIELLDTNKGVLSFWWDEPRVRVRMLAAGLDRDTLYGCALNFLFRPIPNLASVMLPKAQMLVDVNTFSIGIHVRTDFTDRSMKGLDGEKTVQEYWEPFQCALDIETRYAELIGGRQVLWHVASDSDSLRQDARAVYGQGRRHVYVLDAKPTNAYIQSKSDSQPCSYEWDCLDPVPIKALEATFVEWWLFSLNDFFVITDSGMSASSVGRSMKRNTTYHLSIDQEEKREKGQPVCLGEPTAWALIEDLRAGM
ncbi:hypothetical protein KFL_000930350 [Klebsormidium nitens]|uniref:Uncharacterized protein n=1 Tax=Klebsormidium nitens TaxID=105231 RepID=A0A1Y1HXI8_KLENI|nr:hypothetical protein KFL_000930350 [Klebsormidium nitens]|eukprot:GAQ81889.1 hypothetical protein KFL_000930350 [Klebsormidium nitens]